MRPLVADEKRHSLKLGEEYEYPVIFEINKIRIKWEQVAKVQPSLVSDILAPDMEKKALVY